MIEFQRKILGDRVRNDAFQKALQKVIVPGQSTVADLGSGTGFLSFLASTLGAKECYLYEFTDAFFLSKKLAAQNGMKQCHFVHKHSADVRNPTKVDVVVSETLGNYALEENILETLHDAKRFLKPGGVILPQRLTQYVAPVMTDRLFREVNIWDEVGYGLDLSPARDASLQNMYVKTVKPEELLAAGAKEWDHIDFRRDESSVRTADLKWVMDRAQTVYGFALWWSCEVSEGITLATGPSDPLTHWEQIYLPVLKPIALQGGETLHLSLTSDSRYEVKINLSWTVNGQSLDMRRG